MLPLLFEYKVTLPWMRGRAESTVAFPRTYVSV